jgi:hypothetical protein
MKDDDSMDASMLVCCPIYKIQSGEEIPDSC